MLLENLLMNFRFHCTMTEIQHFFVTKAAVYSESKASVNYPCGPFKNILWLNIVLKMSLLGSELSDKKHLA